MPSNAPGNKIASPATQPSVPYSTPSKPPCRAFGAAWKILKRRASMNAAKKQESKLRYAGKEEELKAFLRKRIEEQPNVTQAELRKEIVERFGIVYGRGGFSKLLNPWRIPHKHSNRLYSKSKLYVGNEAVGLVSAEEAGKGHLIDRFGIGAVRKGALGEGVLEGEEEDEDEGEESEEDERMRGLQDDRTKGL